MVRGAEVPRCRDYVVFFTLQSESGESDHVTHCVLRRRLIFWRPGAPVDQSTMIARSRLDQRRRIYRSRLTVDGILSHLLVVLFVFLSACFTPICGGFVFVTKRTSSCLRSAHSSPVLSTSVVSLPGSDPNRPQKVNQDSYFIESSPWGNNNITCVGVMDGHGLGGHLVTAFLKDHLLRCIRREWNEQRSKTATSRVEEMNQKNSTALIEFQRNLKDLAQFEEARDDDFPTGSVESILTRAFIQAHVDALQDPKVPAGRSGTTCIVCIIEGRTLYTAYVGDSRAIMWPHRTGDPSCEATTPSILGLTRETTTRIPQERHRIEICEGRLDGNENVFYGPVGIAMTRALGDGVLLRAGVVPVPDVRSYELPTNGSTVVLATDGVWDVMTNDEVQDLVQSDFERGTGQSVAARLADQARRAWLADLPIEDKVDDITCIILTLS